MSLITICQSIGETTRGIPFQEAARQAMLKLLALFPPALRNRIGQFPQAVQVRLEPRNPLDNQQATYSTLVECIRDRRCIRVDYQSLTPPMLLVTRLSPYQLLFSRRCWYVIGRSSLHRGVRTLNLGRIRDFTLLDDQFQIPARFSLDKHLGNAWHLIREKPYNQVVQLRFSPQVATNVDEVRWHKSQTTSFQADGSMLFQVTVDGLNEISWWIMGYGDQVEVVEPPALRTLIARRIATLCQTYQPELAQLSNETSHAPH